MKKVLKIILAFIVINVIMGIGVWGAITNKSDTEPGWQVWGWLLAVLTIAWPAISFWGDRMIWLLDLED